MIGKIAVGVRVNKRKFTLCQGDDGLLSVDGIQNPFISDFRLWYQAYLAAKEWYRATHGCGSLSDSLQHRWLSIFATIWTLFRSLCWRKTTGPWRHGSRTGRIYTAKALSKPISFEKNNVIFCVSKPSIWQCLYCLKGRCCYFHCLRSLPRKQCEKVPILSQDSNTIINYAVNLRSFRKKHFKKQCRF